MENSKVLGVMEGVYSIVWERGELGECEEGSS